MKDTKDRRKYPRFKVSIPVDCSGVRFLQSKDSRNLSLGGIFIATDLQEKEGTRVLIDFLFKEDWKKIRVLGEVMWVWQDRDVKSEVKQLGGMGIRFINPDAEFIKRIEKIYLDPSLKGIRKAYP